MTKIENAPFEQTGLTSFVGLIDAAEKVAQERGVELARPYGTRKLARLETAYHDAIFARVDTDIEGVPLTYGEIYEMVVAHA